MKKIVVLAAAVVVLSNLYAAEKETSPWQAEWIWHSKPTRFGYFRKIVTVKERPISAKVAVTADNIFTLYVNGVKIGHDSDWTSLETYDVTSHIRPGKNIIAVAAEDPGADMGALLLEGAVNYADGSFTIIKTDDTWKLSERDEPGWLEPGFNDSAWNHPVVIGKPPVGPWGGLEHPQLTSLVPVQALEIQWPRGAKPGDTIDVSLSVKPARKLPAEGPVGIKLLSSGETVYQAWQEVSPTPAEWPAGRISSLKLKGVYLPVYLPTGKLQLKVEAPSADIQGVFDIMLEGGNDYPPGHSAAIKQLKLTPAVGRIIANFRMNSTRDLSRTSDTLYLRLFKGSELWYAANAPAADCPAGKWVSRSASFTVKDLPEGHYTARVCVHGLRCTSCAPVVVKVKGSAPPDYRPMGWGTFIDRDGTPHRWHINQAGTMIWDGKPYIPVGGMYLSPFFMGFNANDPKRNEENWKTDVEKLGKMKTAGITDLYMNPCCNWFDKPLWVWQRMLDLFEDMGFNYGLQATNHLSPVKGYHIAVGDYLVKPDGSKASANISQTFYGKTEEKNRVLYAAWNKDGSDAKVGEAQVSPIQNGVKAEVSIPEETRSVHFIPEFTFNGDMHDYWTDVNDDYRRELAKFFGGLKPGPGFRCFIDLLDNEQSWRDMNRMLPSSPAFQRMFTEWLKKEYHSSQGLTSDEMKASWAIDPAPSFEEAGRLIPLGVPSQDSATGWAYDPVTGKTFIIDLNRSQMWYDMVRFRDWSIRDFNNQVANWIKEHHNVPVVLKLTDSDTFTNNLTAGGFDGVGMEAYGSAPELVRGCGGGVFSRARRANRTIWELVTETGMSSPTDDFIGYPDPLRMVTELSSMAAMGAKGVYYFYFNAGGDSPGNPFYSFNLFCDERQLWWMGAFSKMMKQSTNLVDYLPQVDYFYPGLIAGQLGFSPPYKPFHSDIPSQSIRGNSGRWVVPATTPPPPGSRVIVNLETDLAKSIYGSYVDSWRNDGTREVVMVDPGSDWQQCVREMAGPDTNPDFVRDVLGVEILDLGPAYQGVAVGKEVYIWNMTESSLPIAQAVPDGDTVKKMEIAPPPKAAMPAVVANLDNSEIIGIDQANLAAAIVEWDKARAAAETAGMKTSIVPPADNWRDIYKAAAKLKKEAELFSKTTTAVKVEGIDLDGDLSEWQNITPLTCGIQVKQDFSVPVEYKDALFYCGWDDDGIYLAGNVKDEALVNNYREKMIWNGDCVEVFIDLRPDEEPLITTYNSETYQFLLAPVNAGGVPDVAVVNPSLPSSYRPEKVKMSVKKVQTGWQFEAYIPSSELGGWKPKPGETIGFTFALDDSDGGDRTVQYMWRGKGDACRNRSRFGRLTILGNSGERVKS